MHTVDEEFTTEPGWPARLRRDARVLARLVRMLAYYVIVGGRIRRTYRARAARGELFWVDEDMP